jgi:hypothetical protein
MSIETTHLDRFAPAGSGKIDVTVSNPTGTSETTADKFTYM